MTRQFLLLDSHSARSSNDSTLIRLKKNFDDSDSTKMTRANHCITVRWPTVCKQCRNKSLIRSQCRYTLQCISFFVPGLQSANTRRILLKILQEMQCRI